MPKQRSKRHPAKPATSPSMEQYIETIAQLLTRDKVCSVSDIAEGAKVSRAAASRAVRDLAEKELVEHRAYGYVDLTEKGHALAGELTARHEALFEFFSGVLGIEEGTADREACRLEHQLDNELVDRLGRLTSFFAKDKRLAQKWRRFMDGESS
jgi:DtxR family Mn-dependent transcriptional regulator